GLDERERLRRVHAERFQHLGREHLAHAALEGQPTVAATRPRRLSGPLRTEVEQAAVLDVVELGVQEAATVAELRVVDAELVAVIAERQALGEVVRQRIERREASLPLRVVERVETAARRPAWVPVAPDVSSKTR